MFKEILSWFGAVEEKSNDIWGEASNILCGSWMMYGEIILRGRKGNIDLKGFVKGCLVGEMCGTLVRG